MIVYEVLPFLMLNKKNWKAGPLEYVKYKIIFSIIYVFRALFYIYDQKQPSTGVLRKRCSENMQQI